MFTRILHIINVIKIIFKQIMCKTYFSHGSELFFNLIKVLNCNVFHKNICTEKKEVSLKNA